MHRQTSYTNRLTDPSNPRAELGPSCAGESALPNRLGVDGGVELCDESFGEIGECGPFCVVES